MVQRPYVFMQKKKRWPPFFFEEIQKHLESIIVEKTGGAKPVKVRGWEGLLVGLGYFPFCGFMFLFVFCFCCCLILFCLFTLDFGFSEHYYFWVFPFITCLMNGSEGV